MKQVLIYLKTDFFKLHQVDVETTQVFQYVEMRGHKETMIDQVPVTIFFTIRTSPEERGTLYLNVCQKGTSVDDFESSEKQIVVHNFSYAIEI